MYNGMQKFCNHEYGRECPANLRFQELKEARKGKTDKRKIFSDSTLRSVNQLALTSDIVCMSGAGVGQLCNMIPLDDKYDEVIILAGNNEITKTDSLEEFVYSVEKGVEKLEHLVKKLNDTAVTLCLPCVPTVGAAEIVKARYFEEKMLEINSIRTMKLAEIEYEGTHPTDKGTRDIINQMQVAVGDEFILKEAKDEDLVAKRRYSHVTPVYKVGCRGCDTEEYTAHLCANCIDKSKTVDTQAIKFFYCYSIVIFIVIHVCVLCLHIFIRDVTLNLC